MSAQNRVFLLKLLASFAVAVAMLYPLFSPQGRAGILASLAALGMGWTIVIVVAFLVGIFLYCRALVTCLERVSPAAQAMPPLAVWLMFVPFYNIVEDFFIIRGLTRSLEAESRLTERLAGVRRFGAVSGYGWCVAQVIALAPATLGEVAGLVALVLWLAHWRFITGVSRRLGHQPFGKTQDL